MTITLTYHFAGTRAVILHHSADVRRRVEKRLDVLGVRALGRWSHLEEEDTSADFLIVDIDQAHDAQFPWPRGQAPMPTVALIGSESPGRLGWAIDSRMDAFLPLAAIGNLYSALVVGQAVFERRLAEGRRAAEAARRAGRRLEVIRAVLSLMDEEGVSDETALKRLRAFAMVERIPLEDAAGLYLTERGGARRGRA